MNSEKVNYLKGDDETNLDKNIDRAIKKNKIQKY